eukprot:TRINITY_DN595_c0_g1_i2.p1 TRINITY_DN595_c0_g1~~TRINITY_DN595_c0_g1_i2.p1  ORF type:complete len:211 (-),score=87.12 TRINITY_DN595_c0_g1_i2:181-813(-)
MYRFSILFVIIALLGACSALDLEQHHKKGSLSKAEAKTKAKAKAPKVGLLQSESKSSKKASEPAEEEEPAEEAAEGEGDDAAAPAAAAAAPPAAAPAAEAAPVAPAVFTKIAPFGKEDTAKELQEHASRTQDTLVDAVENAEVAEIKRSVFRALTRLRAASIKEFDTIARLETQAIDGYNDAHHYRSENPLAHLHEEEAPVETDKLKSFH